MSRERFCAPAVTLLLVIALAPPASSATPLATSAPSPEAEAPPKNLKVLPKDWTRRQVVEVMKTWTGDLGIRCQHCHVGQEGQPFSEWNFADDEKATKQRARDMFQMLGEINHRLGAMSNLHDSAAPSPLATCGTCHRGIARPQRIEDLFEATRATASLAAALTEYRALRSESLASGSYDFSARPLVRQARRQLAAKDVAGARQVMDMALDLGLDGLMARLTLVDVALAEGDNDAALGHLEKALALPLNPAEKAFVTERREELLAKKPTPP